MAFPLQNCELNYTLTILPLTGYFGYFELPLG
jgi:hypothetical protein